MTISTVVMTHPSRVDRARRLAGRWPDLAAEVVTDPEPDGYRSTLRVAGHAWSAVPDDATHHLVLQDDAVLCDGFPDLLAEAVRTYPDCALALFCEWGSDTSYVMRFATLGGIGWVPVTDHYVPSVALVLPAEVARTFGRRAVEAARRLGDDTAPAELAEQDDVALRQVLFEAGVPIVAPVPNLVDHEPGPSLAGNDYMGPRRSACFRDDVGPAGSHTDGQAVLKPGTVPYYSWFNGDTLAINPDATTPYGIRVEPIGAEIARRGLVADRVAEEAAAALSRWHAEYPGMPPEPLEHLWTYAYVLGVVIAGDPIRRTTPAADPLPDLAPPVDRAACERLLAQPATARTLATLPQGALRTFTGHDVLAMAEKPLADLMREAVLAGFDAARALPEAGS